MWESPINRYIKDTLTIHSIYHREDVCNSAITVNRHKK